MNQEVIYNKEKNCERGCESASFRLLLKSAADGIRRDVPGVIPCGILRGESADADGMGRAGTYAFAAADAFH